MSVSPPSQAGATCPSCGRFVGPLEKCPHCGAEIKKRLPLRYLRLACLVLALSGIGILLYAVSGAATPSTKIGNIGATLNYAYVQVNGVVTRGPIYDPDAQTLRFYITDDTGEIQAAAFRDVTQQLIAQNKIPTIGDTITTEGTLRIRDDFTSLSIASADKLELTPPSARDLKISDISYDDVFHNIRLSGDVREIRQPYQGLTLITVGDASGELDVAVNADIEKLYGALPTFILGDQVEVEGVVTYFRDLPQLVVRHPRDFQKRDADNTAAGISQIGDLNESRVGQLIQISGQVTQLSEFSQGQRASVDDGTGEITLLLWQDLFEQLPDPHALRKGVQVRIVGKLSQYRGDMEITPSGASDLEISAPVTQNIATPQANGAASDPISTPEPTRTPRPDVEERTIGSIKSTDKDARVIVTAKITRASQFSQGRRYTLDDGSGKITLLVWSDVLEKIGFRDALVPGTQVRVTGKVDIFNDNLEIVPERADAVELLAAVLVPIQAARSIQSLSTDDLDKVVLVQATVADIDDFSSGKYVTAQDNSGTIRVTVFDSVLSKIQDKLVTGAKIAVRGKVNIFRGNLEIIADQITFR